MKSSVLWGILICSFVAQAAEPPRALEPTLAVSKQAPQLPQPPTFGTFSEDRPVAPPPPSPMRHYEVRFLVPANLGGGYEDFALPAGKIVALRWQALAPNSTTVSEGLDVIVWSPSMGINLLSSGAQELVLGPSVSNVRAIVRKTRNLPTLAVTLSIDIQ